MKLRTMLALVALGVAFVAAPSPGADWSPSSVASVVSICGPVISEQLAGDDGRRGLCISATSSFLQAVRQRATIGGVNAEAAELVAEMATLYTAEADCAIARTELAEAIDRARRFSTDRQDREFMALVSQTVRDCQDEGGPVL